MRLSFFGAAQNVTGSKHLLDVDGFRVLLDCGLSQGNRAEAEQLNRHLPFDAKTVDAVILSHAHADHCGLLPLLVKNGFRGRVYCTTATADIAEYILLDSANLQHQDAEYYNQHLQRGDRPVQPLYTEQDVDNALRHITPVPYFHITRSWTRLTPNIRFKLYDAGHILGSAMVVLEIIEQGQTKTVAFSGDLGGGPVPILHESETIAEPVQTLLMECTYGDRIHAPLPDVYQKLTDIIHHALAHKSKIYVPAFSLGRTQEIIYILHQLVDQKKIPHLPIFIDSPLSNKISKVFEDHQEDYNKQTYVDFGKKHELPFQFQNLHYVNTVEQSKALNSLRGPFIVVSASGMMEGGRILHHLKNGISDANNVIIITGYQGVGTLGRKIQDGISQVRIYDRFYKVRARVFSLDEFSAHADQSKLLTFVENQRQLQKLFLVHTELPQSTAFQLLVKKKLPHVEVVIPSLGQQFTI